jgi:FMN phosphatase YigB (HAD superfamily)
VAFDFGGTLGHGGQVDPGVIPVLGLLYTRGVRLLVASNTVADQDRQISLSRAGVDGLFREILQSYVLGVAKPDPRFYDAVVSAADCSAEQVLFVGNDLNKDVAGPMAAGMQAALVRSGPLEDVERLPIGALLIAHLDELPDLLSLWGEPAC